MSGFPQELFLVLIFGAFVLVQFLIQQVRKKAAAMQAEAESRASGESTAMLPEADPTSMDAETADTWKLVEAPQAVPPAMAALASPLTRPHRRRFSRAELMPNRRAVQDAIVIAAIMRPCHAHRPHDAG